MEDIIADDHFDAVLHALSEDGKTAIFMLRDGQTLTYRVTPPSWKVGAVGVLVELVNDKFQFREYPDPRLRRAPEYDAEGGDVWGWTIQEASGVLRPLTAKAGVIPGKDGAVVPDETQPVQIDVPPEFFELCDSRGIEVEQALRAFIADLCELHNYIVQPREDGYSSNGSDERHLANEYFDRAFFN